MKRVPTRRRRSFGAVASTVVQAHAPCPVHLWRPLDTGVVVVTDQLGNRRLKTPVFQSKCFSNVRPY